MTLSAQDHSWHVSSGSGNGSQNSNSTNSLHATGSYSYRDSESNLIPGTLADDNTAWESSTGTWSTTLTAMGQWQTTGSSEVDLSGSRTFSTYGGSGNYRTTSGTVVSAGTFNEHGSVDSGDSYSMVSTLANETSWQVTAGTMSHWDNSDNSYTYNENSQAYSTLDATMSMAGTQNAFSGGSSGDHGSYTQVRGVSDTWALTSSGRTQNSGTNYGSSYHGSGTYSLVQSGATISGPVSEEGGSTFSNTTLNSLSLAANASSWVATSQSQTYAYHDHGTFSYSGSGPYTAIISTSLGDRGVSGTYHQNGSNASGTDRTVIETRGANGSWTMSSNTGTDIKGDMTHEDFTGSGSSCSESGNSDHSSDFTASLTLGANQTWSTTGGHGSSTDSGSYHAEASKTVNYSWDFNQEDTAVHPLAYGQSVSHYSKDSTYQYTAGSVLDSQGHYNFSGSGKAGRTIQDTLTYSGSGSGHVERFISYVINGAGMSEGGPQTFSENGSSKSYICANTDWTMDPGGTWKVSNGDYTDSGTSGGNYSYNNDDTYLEIDRNGSVPSTFRASFSDRVSEQFTYQHSQTLHCDASGVFTGTGSGSASASGSQTFHEGTWNGRPASEDYRDWVNRYSYASQWNQNYGGGSIVSSSSSGSGTQSGSVTASINPDHLSSQGIIISNYPVSYSAATDVPAFQHYYTPLTEPELPNRYTTPPRAHSWTGPITSGGDGMPTLMKAGESTHPTTDSIQADATTHSVPAMGTPPPVIALAVGSHSAVYTVNAGSYPAISTLSNGLSLTGAQLGATTSQSVPSATQNADGSNNTATPPANHGPPLWMAALMVGYWMTMRDLKGSQAATVEGTKVVIMGATGFTETVTPYSPKVAAENRVQLAARMGGRAIGMCVGVGEIFGGTGLVVGGSVAEAGTMGGATPVAVPAVAAGAGLTTLGVLTIHNGLFKPLDYHPTQSSSSTPQSGNSSKFGAKGQKITSKTVWTDGIARIDIENRAPGVDSAQIHLQYKGSTVKYYYDIATKTFETDTGNKLSISAEKKLFKDPTFLRGLDKAFKFLGEVERE